jgi:YfiH family protein
MQSNEHWITPTWPAALQVKALTTLRTGGVSAKPFDSFNLAEHVDDDPSAVKENRSLLRTLAKLPQEPCWINQVHGTTVLNLADYPSSTITSSIVPTADASICINANHISVVLTADCLPILLCDQKGTRVAAVHAGWRGLAAGILQKTVESLDCDPKNLMAWLGPAIGPQVFEVGKDVKEAFNMAEDPSAFKAKAIATTSTTDASTTEKWLANLYTLARLRLQHLGISQIYGGEFCTFTEKDKFYSFRRSNPTGRQATLIWLES